jgi:ABC-type dipeptide/oligopeptide/nickel transport system permease component
MKVWATSRSTPSSTATLPLIQGIVLLFALLFTGVNLAVDLLYAVLNPRLRHG